jgi:hypothetical protein
VEELAPVLEDDEEEEEDEEAPGNAVNVGQDAEKKGDFW